MQPFYCRSTPQLESRGVSQELQRQNTRRPRKVFQPSFGSTAPHIGAAAGRLPGLSPLRRSSVGYTGMIPTASFEGG